MSATTTSSPKVWFITGCSTGFGREIAIAAHNRGDFVIATARKLSALDDLRELGCDTFALDITADDDAVKQVVGAAAAVHGRIDILVNNAGISLLKIVEETSASEVVRLFDTNVFGLLRVTRAVLPFMRAQKSGTIANVGSVGGHVTMPVCGVYCASKAAVAGVSQALAMELAPFNIEVTVIEPGIFRTAIIDKLDLSPPSIADYAPVMKVVMEQVVSSKAGNSTKAAQAIVEALTLTGRAAGRQLPNRLALGGGVLDMIQSTIDCDQKDLNDWKDYTDAKAFAFDEEQ